MSSSLVTLDEVTLEDALKKYPRYAHNEEYGFGQICSVRKGNFCSMCGAGECIAWIIRNKKEVDKPYETALMIYEKWNSQRWYGANETRPYLKVMLADLKPKE